MTNKNECQICENHFSLRKARLVKHGYKRPGNGFLVGECFGAHRVSYQDGFDALEEYREVLARMHASAVEHAAELASEQPSFNRVTLEYQRRNGIRVYAGRVAQMEPVVTSYAVGVSTVAAYERALVAERHARAARERSLSTEIDRVATRIREWPNQHLEKKQHLIDEIRKEQV